MRSKEHQGPVPESDRWCSCPHSTSRQPRRCRRSTTLRRSDTTCQLCRGDSRTTALRFAARSWMRLPSIALLNADQHSAKLFVLPIRIFGMFQIPQRTPASDHRQFREVVIRWRGCRRPLQRPRIPRIVSGNLAFVIRRNDVEHPYQHAQRLENHTDRDNQIPTLPSPAGIVGVNAAPHAEQPGNMHEVERHMETDQEQPEVPFTQAVAHHPTGYFGVPVVCRGKRAKDDDTQNHIVEMSDYKVRVAELPIERRSA